ncbi:uncharacterized protein CELE_T24E12.12 [Caenorhabditis elegans]|uniref:Uncharacterized protein n=1 Tax=Caenorhabditis elegans TaxID=6239 RepID=Q4W4Z7_CAEEL|nr:Uncharacterized protein CELE_T24E12.12 [Caenorhabditis elegans]CCD69338.2 Uncharacterized protein CELE_T24E12.12 [Caenorhabditis elegans]|eukprot:NP_001022360.2 Uncharacterized protein CELE_T24E12.12 [Caenorhabditis elegans]
MTNPQFHHKFLTIDFLISSNISSLKMLTWEFELMTIYEDDDEDQVPTNVTFEILILKLKMENKRYFMFNRWVDRLAEL